MPSARILADAAKSAVCALCGRTATQGVQTAPISVQSKRLCGWIATSYSLSAGFPILAASLLALVPLFLFAAPDTTRQDLSDFVDQTG